jgi:hypothetical protein
MHDTTYYGLNSWSKHMFEKFGYILLAHDDGDKKYVRYYTENLEYLIKHIDLKINNLKKSKKLKCNCDHHNLDKINDLEILKKNLLTLHKYSKKICK